MRKGYFVYVPELRTVVESRDVVFYEQFGHDCVPGQVPYDGSPYVKDTNPTINGDVSDDQGNSLPHTPPLAAAVDTGTTMVLRPRPGVPRAERSEDECVGATTLELESTVPPLSLTAQDAVSLNRPPVGPGLSKATSVLPDTTLKDGHPESVFSHLICPSVQNFQVHDSATLQPASALQPDEALHRQGVLSPATSLSELSELDLTGLDGLGWGSPTLPRPTEATRPGETVVSAPKDSGGPRTRSRGLPIVQVPPSGVPTLLFSAAPTPSTSAAPLSYKAATALDNPEREHWLIAMKDEVSSLTAHGTWLLCPPVPYKKSPGCPMDFC